MTNIRDIAKKSGYSASTVSRFLNQTGYVSQSAKQAIQQVIDELEYDRYRNPTNAAPVLYWIN